ncbi:MAG TPA: DUF3667 domain-containing protein [Gemmatimonadaceae bacterium]|nr:DUF3667 domain-containing protein [Gemmatimonadaceae bacterium]
MAIQPTDAAAHWHNAERSARCLNCGAPLNGPYCAQCGQRDIPPYPSVRELAIDAVSEFSGWDGRLLNTLRTLLLRPGLLTHEFLEGRRSRYISPLRLYLSASVIYFLLAAAAPDLRLGNGRSLSGIQVGVSTGTASSTAPRRVATAANDALGRGQPITEEERQAALKDIGRAPKLMQPFLRRVVGDPNGFKRGLMETMPKMLFVLLPIFAAIVALFYHGRKYPEHLYFAIHLHAFIFIALSIVAAAKFTGSVPFAVAASVLCVVWIPIYATVAFRRVYATSLASTILRELGIAVLYAVVSVGALIVTLYWVSVAT